MLNKVLISHSLWLRTSNYCARQKWKDTRCMFVCFPATFIHACENCESNRIEIYYFLRIYEFHIESESHASVDDDSYHIICETIDARLCKICWNPKNICCILRWRNIVDIICTAHDNAWVEIHNNIHLNSLAFINDVQIVLAFIWYVYRDRVIHIRTTFSWHDRLGRIIRTFRASPL